MAKSKKTWQYNPPPAPKPQIPETLKKEVKKRIDSLIASALKPKYIKPPSQNETGRYLVDIFCKWVGNYFYVCTRYQYADKSSTIPFFEKNYARMEYLGEDLFKLYYLRHTGRWYTDISYEKISLTEALQSIEEDPNFVYMM